MIIYRRQIVLIITRQFLELITMLKLKNSIQTKVLLAFMSLIIAVVSMVLFTQTNSSNSIQLNEEKFQIYGLADTLRSIEQSSKVYKSNAARDYDSYFRDLDVYYKVISQMLTSIDEKVSNLSATKTFLIDLSSSPTYYVAESGVEKLVEKIDATQEAWSQFRAELNQQFGENLDEPRLEWGADYIVENSQALVVEFESLLNIFNEINIKQNNISKTSGKTVIVILLLFSSAFAAFFYWQVISPIQTTSQAFVRVSDGDFGHQIDVARNDEIGQLVHSFNQMSARSNTVLSIISRLQSVASVEDVINILYSELKIYTSLDLVIYTKPNKANNAYLLNDISPQANFKNLFKVTIPIGNKAQQDYIENISNQGHSIQIDNIETFLKLYPNAVILKSLIRRYPLKSAILQPLSSSLNGAMLIFVSYHEKQLNPAHQELINHLMPFINHKLVDVESRNGNLEQVDPALSLVQS